MENTELIQEKIGYTFKNPSLLESAITHSSYANENQCDNNERLEFLGDSILSLVVSDCLFKKYGHVNEGRLSKIRASLVCEQSLAQIAKKIDLGNIIRLGKGEQKTGGRERASIVSDAFEALIAAIYLDSGIRNVTKWILKLMKTEIAEAEQKRVFGDFKTQLQEMVQKRNHGKVQYRLVEEKGEEHVKVFVMAADINGKEMGIGEGFSKKEAEQHAAKMAVDNLTK